jgi:hypothetical protein
VPIEAHSRIQIWHSRSSCASSKADIRDKVAGQGLVGSREKKRRRLVRAGASQRLMRACGSIERRQMQTLGLQTKFSRWHPKAITKTAMGFTRPGQQPQAAALSRLVWDSE